MKPWSRPIRSSSVICASIRCAQASGDSPLCGEAFPCAARAGAPGLKLVLELGPLLVFFFANSYGERLAKWFPMLAELGGPIFIATGLFMAATVISATRALPYLLLGHSSCSPEGSASAAIQRSHAPKG